MALEDRLPRKQRDASAGEPARKKEACLPAAAPWHTALHLTYLRLGPCLACLGQPHQFTHAGLLVPQLCRAAAAAAHRGVKGSSKGCLTLSSEASVGAPI